MLLAHMDGVQRKRALQQWVRAPLGYERGVSYVVKSVTNLSCPIQDERQCAVAALAPPGIQLADGKVSEADALASLHGAAREISSAIGGSYVPAPLQTSPEG